MWRRLLGRLGRGFRPDTTGWVSLATEAPLSDLLEAADRVRERLHPDGRVGYVVDRNVNYTNVCLARCSFCAFHRPPGDSSGYVLDAETIDRKVEETVRSGGSGVLLQGGLHPDLKLEWFVALLARLKSAYRIYLHCFSPPEIAHLARSGNTSVLGTINRLREAGLDSIPGGGAEILVDEVRDRWTTKCAAREWIDVCETAHRAGVATTATMVLGLGESIQDRFRHLEVIRSLQGRTGGILAFIPWTFQPDNTRLGASVRSRLPVEEYLRWLALARLYLDNILNIQVSRLTQGVGVAVRGLRGGANDIGSVMIEENVVAAAGAHHVTTEPILVETIVRTGFVPVRRNAGYVRLEDANEGLLVLPETLPGGPRPAPPRIG